MRVAVVYNEVGENPTPDEADVLTQRDAISEALGALGHEPILLGATLRLELLQQRLLASSAHLVFNIVESLDNQGRLIHLVPSLLDAMGIPYTGAPAEAMMLTSNKLLAKELLRAGSIPTPATVLTHPAHLPSATAREPFQEGKMVIKSVWEHASVGLDEEWLFDACDEKSLLAEMARRAPVLGKACFAEPYVEGREFNLSVLAGPKGPEVMPPAEIDFSAFPADKPRIVGYRAKWDESSFEYHNTPRRFDHPEEDGSLLDELRRLALRAWRVFGLRGYARVDFRVDLQGNPWILEINANPCLSPDAGFAAAVERGGIGFVEAVSRILADSGP